MHVISDKYIILTVHLHTVKLLKCVIIGDNSTKADVGNFYDTNLNYTLHVFKAIYKNFPDYDSIRFYSSTTKLLDCAMFNFKNGNLKLSNLEI